MKTEILMKIVKESVYSILLIIFTSTIGWAATYYVDYQSGTDTNNGTSTSTPWKHSPGDASATNNANITLAAGDIVVFKGGVSYTGTGSGTLITINNSGSSGREIVYRGNTVAENWGTGKAIIDLVGVYDRAFDSIGRSYIKLINLQVQGHNNSVGSNIGAIRFNDSTNIEIKDSLIQNAEYWDVMCAPGSDGSVQAFGVGLYLQGSSNVIVDNVEFYRLGRDGMRINPGTNITVKNSEFHEYMSVAIRIAGGSDGIVVQDSIFHDMWQYEGDDVGEFQHRCHAGDWVHMYGTNNGLLEAGADPHNILFERNLMYNDKAFNYANGTANSFMEDNVYNVTWRNNVIINPHHFGFDIQNSADDIYIYNNTIITYNPALSNWAVNPITIGAEATYPISNPTGGEINVEILNNVLIAYHSNTNVPVLNIGPGAIMPTRSSNNVFYRPEDPSNIVSVGSADYSLSQWQAQTCGLSLCGTGSASGNPNLIRVPTTGATASSGNYHLSSSSSSSINRGVTIVSFSDDKDGVSRPQGAVWDIGAYERANDNIAPSPPVIK